MQFWEVEPEEPGKKLLINFDNVDKIEFPRDPESKGIAHIHYTNGNIDTVKLTLTTFSRIHDAYQEKKCIK